MEEKVATAQRQARLLSDTKAILEEQIHRQDEARLAAHQQFDQTKAALEHQIRVRDQTNAALQQTYHQMKTNLEHQIELKERARVSTQQQFHQMKSTLEHQLREKENIMVDLHAIIIIVIYHRSSQLVCGDKPTAVVVAW